MREEFQNIKSDPGEIRKFGWTVGLFLAILAGLLYWRGEQAFLTVLLAGLALLLLGLVLPAVLKPVHWIWMAIAVVLGWIMTRLILGVLFYAVISPIALVARLAGKDFLRVAWEDDKVSYWNTRTPGKSKEDYERQF